jgi:tetratricopeptide (TPR) repeat protein
VLRAIGDVQQFRKEMDAALASYEQALMLFRVVGDRLGEANVLRAIGDVQQFRQEVDAALASYEQALMLFRAVGARLGEANVLRAIGDVQQFRQEADTALASYEQALMLFRAVGDRLGEANVLGSQGQLALVSGDQARADQLLDQVINIYRMIGNNYGVAAQIGNYGWALIRVGRRDDARSYLLRAAELFAAMGLDNYAERHRQAAESIFSKTSFRSGHALIIGIGSYQHESGLNVPITAADAQAVATVLRDPQYCGYPETQVSLLSNAGATREGILAALTDLAVRTKPDDTVPCICQLKREPVDNRKGNHFGLPGRTLILEKGTS